MIEFFNNFFAPLYELYFDSTTNPAFLDSTYRNSKYTEIGWALVLIPFIFLFIFYKVWDPIKNSKLKWILTLLISAITSSMVTYLILIDLNDCSQMLLKEHNGGESDYLVFVFSMSLISFSYSVISMLILTVLPISLLSFNNKFNPF